MFLFMILGDAHFLFYLQKSVTIPLSVLMLKCRKVTSERSRSKYIQPLHPLAQAQNVLTCPAPVVRVPSVGIGGKSRDVRLSGLLSFAFFNLYARSWGRHPHHGTCGEEVPRETVPVVPEKQGNVNIQSPDSQPCPRLCLGITMRGTSKVI